MQGFEQSQLMLRVFADWIELQNAYLIFLRDCAKLWGLYK